ncbi:type II toxin-antitoxin system ParD family antitoxin [Corynebacterium variabile]|uniref:type II toxin-antitoxin system ParD family antitoxin n=1 Tax=Corynebacterium variabile TaxID=1727 RepID=UPI00289C8977|nr:type II toxin-antitoxin system ParD family antitoxin [Corynebacterium variabile]
MPTRNVVITDHQQKLVEELVESGEYQNASEVLREGLRLVEKQRAEDAARLEALRRHVATGEIDIAAGRYVDVELDELDGFMDDLAQQVMEARQQR